MAYQPWRFVQPGRKPHPCNALLEPVIPPPPRFFSWPTNVVVSFDCVQTFPDPEYRVWIFDSQYCTVGLKVEFPVLNVDGTAVPEPSSTADPPSLNAPIPDPESPPPPPDAPLAEAGGPTTNAATSQAPAHWTLLAIAVAACFLKF